MNKYWFRKYTQFISIQTRPCFDAVIRDVKQYKMQSGSVVYLGLAVVLLCSGTFTQARYAGERSAIARLLTRLLDSETRELPSPSRDVEDSSLLQILSDVSKKNWQEDCRKYCAIPENAEPFYSEGACRQANDCS
ncbi:unnamed protein product [Owenia fusiformis]|uniref:Uncharacterized protein n=1 Tax=Owenia fusiformis TaxID=6347 RepID=A0A8J1UQY0_OWEFU|nr:unnamed protein product [Owenia fusiformis]